MTYTKRTKRKALRLLSQKKANGKPIYSKYEVADMLKISRPTLYKWIREAGMEIASKSNFHLTP